MLDVTIVGAGPYGLSAAAHLREIPGLEMRIFGEPMSFWESSMPVGMFLRSNWPATHIAAPHGSLGLADFIAADGREFNLPVPIENFIQYGKWYQRQAVPAVERKNVVRLDKSSLGFRLLLDSGEIVLTRRVVIAAGIGAFPRRPAEFANLPPEMVSHTSEYRGFERFHGKTVLVVGGGQSALESAALLHEAGAEVEVIVRERHVHWLQGLASKTLHHRTGKLIPRLLYAPTDVGPAGISQLVARPELLRRLPRAVQDRLWRRSVRPAGARWLVKRLEPVPIRLGRWITAVNIAGEKLNIRLDNGAERPVDHLLLGTGYRVDIAQYSFLSPQILTGIECVEGYPLLRSGLETTIPGLHILGAPAARSFGPILQFVSGTRYASPALQRCIARAKPAAYARSSPAPVEVRIPQA